MQPREMDSGRKTMMHMHFKRVLLAKVYLA